VLHYLKTVEKVGKTEGIPVAMAMKAAPINDMYSKDVHLRADGRAVRDFHLFGVKSRADSKGLWDDYKLLQTLPRDEAFSASASPRPLLHLRTPPDATRHRSAPHSRRRHGR
jgi:branched-chain amino acid transport system substrate-binding protein